MSLGERIKELRKARGLSQEQLADSLDVSRQAISKWETDQSSPEIENILALSSVFSVSTDELLGKDIAGDNATPAPQAETGMKKQSFFSSLIKSMLRAIDSKVIFLVFSILCFIAIGTCVIVNYAIDQRITWAAYPILSVPAGWLITAPIIFKKYTISMCMLTVSAFPLLYLLAKITPVTNWFIPLGLPAAISGAVCIWAIYLLFRYIKINLWFKSSITVALCGVLDILIINHFVDAYLDTKTGFLQYFISIFSYTITFVLLLILGYLRSKRKAASQ